NLYHSEGGFLWLRIAEYEGDWIIEHDDDDFIGECPDWMDSFGILEEYENTLNLNRQIDAPVMDWALRHGLSPGQRFVVWCGTPQTFRCSWEHEEYDIEFWFEIVLVEP